MSRPNPASAIALRRSATVSVASAAIPDLLGVPQLEFVRVCGKEALSELFTYDVYLRAVSSAAEQALAEADPDAMLGLEMTVSIQLEGRGTGLAGGMGAGHREITGVIAEVEQIERADDRRLYRFTLRPWLWLGTLNQDWKPFQNKTVLDILDDVFERYAFSVDKRLDIAAYPKLEWEVQAGESDARFVQRLTEEYGISYFFEHDGGHHRLVLVSELGAYRRFHSSAYHTLAVYPQGFKIDEEHLYRFEPVNRLRTGKVTLNDYDFRQPRANLTEANSQPRDTGHAEFERYEYPGDYTVRKDGDRRARIRMEERRARGRRARGVGALRGVVPGCTFTLVNHPNAALNREHLVTSASLDLEDNGGEAGSKQRYRCRVEFDAHPTDEVFRPPRTVEKPRIGGLVRAVVTGPKDQEVWCNEYGSVKVQLEWDRYGRRNEHSSPWVRTVNGWSGNQYGAMHIPRIGEEVLVGFLNGDADRPFIVGRVTNQLNMPPWALPGQHALSGFRGKELFGQRSGHVLVDDSKEQIQAQIASDHQTSQLSVGYLTGIFGNAGRQDKRGEGFDLRTDGQGAVRGGKGLLLSADPQDGAKGGHLDRAGLIDCMGTAHETARSLGEYGAAHEGHGTDAGPQEALAKAVKEWDAGANNHKDAPGAGGQPVLAAYAPAGIAVATPKALTTYAGKHLDTVAKLNQQLTAGQKFVVNAGTGIGLFAHGGDLRAIAHRGELLLQAQKAGITLNAHGDAVFTSTTGDLVFNAGKNIVLMSADGAGIRIGGGKVEIFGPSGVLLHTADYDMLGPASLTGPLPQFSSGDAGRAFQFVRKADGEPIANVPYSLLRADGSAAEGEVDGSGKTPLDSADRIEAVTAHFRRPKLF